MKKGEENVSSPRIASPTFCFRNMCLNRMVHNHLVDVFFNLFFFFFFFFFFNTEGVYYIGDMVFNFTQTLPHGLGQSNIQSNEPDKSLVGVHKQIPCKNSRLHLEDMKLSRYLLIQIFVAKCCKKFQATCCCFVVFFFVFMI